MGQLESKMVLVTAAAQGIGRASAIAFAAARVDATDINEVLPAELPKSGDLTTERLDVFDDEAVRTFYEQVLAAFVARQPIGRICTPEEVADLAVYPAGATYTTGQAFAIDGGWSL